MEDKSKLTAMSRKDLSAPIKTWIKILKRHHYIKDGEYRGRKDNILHHGCGRSTKDSDFLKSIASDYAEFDPNFAPDRTVLNKEYDTVVSNFVLNVLRPEDRQEAWMDIMMATKQEGFARIAVRSDKDTSIKGTPDTDGVLTKRGTFQKGYSVQDLTEEAEGFFNYVDVIQRGHYLIAICSLKIN